MPFKVAIIVEVVDKIYREGPIGKDRISIGNARNITYVPSLTNHPRNASNSRTILKTLEYTILTKIRILYLVREYLIDLLLKLSKLIKISLFLIKLR
jgi:hypothetical protein